MPTTVHLLDTGAGNILSVINALKKLGYQVEFITNENDFDVATRVIFPGVGAFGPAMDKLTATRFIKPLKRYIANGGAFMGICVGMQALVLSSTESPGVEGLGLIPAICSKFDAKNKSVPHMGWNSACSSTDSPLINHGGLDSSNNDETFISSIRKGNVFATQFHPEKSGLAGLKVIESFLKSTAQTSIPPCPSIPESTFTNRIIACLDVRENDQGDLVVTKGDQYDVRESKGSIRNMGKPVSLAERYFANGADEITFLNITSFRSMPLDDLPMLQVLKQTSQQVFVPLCIGGGIRAIAMPDGRIVSALEVAQEYFRSGADKVSIGSDAVYAAEAYLSTGIKDGSSSIEQISRVYGSQAVVISVDPRRVYVDDPSSTSHECIKTKFTGPNGQEYCWYECTVKGGREARDLDVVQLTSACQELGAGEILLNCMDKDGSNSGFDLELLTLVKSRLDIPVIASSGAGCSEHFAQALLAGADAALAAGIFHRNEVEIKDVKGFLKKKGFHIRSVY